MSVLVDHEITYLCQDDLVTPFNPESVQPASIDMALGRSFRYYKHHEVSMIDLADVPSGITEEVIADSFLIQPGEFILGSTYEVVNIPDNLVGRIEGKSSLGRLGLIVHATAGYLDPGFSGNITLEMTNLLRVPIRVRSGFDICQVSFQRLSAVPSKSYEGRYQGDRGAAESRYGKELSQ